MSSATTPKPISISICWSTADTWTRPCSGQDGSHLKELLDAEVEITGAVAGKFDSKMQLAGIMLQVPSLADVKILKPAATKPGSLPITPMDQILDDYSVQDQTQRVRVRGTITYYQPGTALVLQDGERSLWIETQYEGPLHIGERRGCHRFSRCPQQLRDPDRERDHRDRAPRSGARRRRPDLGRTRRRQACL